MVLMVVDTARLGAWAADEQHRREYFIYTIVGGSRMSFCDLVFDSNFISMKLYIACLVQFSGEKVKYVSWSDHTALQDKHSAGSNDHSQLLAHIKNC